ncbi:hypothetical protein HZH68_001567 [Vespula germanica]|uniref:Uncharacterized protein n=1 Tax=Vespula germanica TaxID=30212 RepID=A0A834NWB4_VESGE|nr:hypothetical protein HZH68_001567 [Vespula germanica]
MAVVLVVVVGGGVGGDGDGGGGGGARAEGPALFYFENNGRALCFRHCQADSKMSVSQHRTRLRLLLLLQSQLKDHGLRIEQPEDKRSKTFAIKRQFDEDDVEDNGLH